MRAADELGRRPIGADGEGGYAGAVRGIAMAEGWRATAKTVVVTAMLTTVFWFAAAAWWYQHTVAASEEQPSRNPGQLLQVSAEPEPKVDVPKAAEPKSAEG